MHSPLMLQTVLGLDAARVATAFLVPAATMGQRLVRTKAKILRAGIQFTVPPKAELPRRLAAVLDAIYSTYSTGWDDPGGFDHRRVGLTDEAIRLATVLVEVLPDEPEVLGLCAMLLHSNARRGARRSGDGAFVALSEQDIRQWSRDEMARAEAYLADASDREHLGPYQLQAAIQSVHNRRAIDGRTDWRTIATLYDGLVAFTPTIGALVARAAAHAEWHGPRVSLAMLGEIGEMHRARAERYQPYHATHAHLLGQMGESGAAARAARRAIELTDDPTVRVYLVTKHDLHSGDG